MRSRGTNQSAPLIINLLICAALVCRGEGFLAEYRTNVFGVINVTNSFLPSMREKQSGTIVVIGSRSAWQAGVPVSRSLNYVIAR